MFLVINDWIKEICGIIRADLQSDTKLDTLLKGAPRPQTADQVSPEILMMRPIRQRDLPGKKRTTQ